MAEVATVRVQRIADGEDVVINATDFDQKLYRLASSKATVATTEIDAVSGKAKRLKRKA